MSTTGDDERGGHTRYQLSVQRSRGWSYVLAVALACFLRAVDALDVTYLDIALLALASFVSVVVCEVIIRRLGREPAWLQPAWMAFDLGTVTVASWRTGGADSPWFVMYAANVVAAAFVGGKRAGYVIAAANTVAYLAMLVIVGEAELGDPRFFDALARMLLLNGALSFAIAGIEDLKAKRAQIRKLKEDESRKVAELTRLTRILDERTQALAEANLAIRAADRMKSQFLANMSHELRTPLNSIIGFSEVLVTRLGGTLEPKHKRFLETIHTSGNHLLGLINDILDLSKIEAGQMELHTEPVDVAATVDGVLAVMKGTAAPRQIGFEVALEADLPELEADPVRFKQILYNLLANAVKFSPPESTVRVTGRALTASASPLGVASVELAVIDRGIGIDAANHELIFQEFRQVDGGTARSYEGTGLGLALVKRFVELHRGRIRVDSRAGEGATFTMVVPVELAEAGSYVHPTLTPVLAEDPRPLVLIVDDDPTIYERLAEALAGADYRCARASNGLEALRLARTLRPAAITLDLVMPGPDGWEVLRRLREDAATRAIPVIVISMLDERELGVARGVDAYFIKPPEGDELVQRVRALVPTPASKESSRGS